MFTIAKDSPVREATFLAPYEAIAKYGGIKTVTRLGFGAYFCPQVAKIVTKPTPRFDTIFLRYHCEKSLTVTRKTSKPLLR